MVYVFTQDHVRLTYKMRLMVLWNVFTLDLVTSSEIYALIAYASALVHVTLAYTVRFVVYAFTLELGTLMHFDLRPYFRRKMHLDNRCMRKKMPIVACNFVPGGPQICHFQVLIR